MTSQELVATVGMTAPELDEYYKRNDTKDDLAEVQPFRSPESESGSSRALTSFRTLHPTRASDVVLKRVRWLMPDWFVLGGLNLLAGREGLGKSTIAVDIAARVTRGTLDGELCGTPHSVIYLATEDDPAFTVAPRLRAAGADLSRVLFLSVHTPTSTEGVVSLPGDLVELERIIAENDVALVVLDAATSVMDARLDGHDDRKVRQFLEPLAQSAGRHDYTVIGLCHFGKREGVDTGKLILGSLAWSQVPRSVVSVARDDEAEQLIVTNTKGNLATRTLSMAARLVSATVATEDGDTSVGKIEWLGESDSDARDLLAASPTGRQDDDAADVDVWLRKFLEDGNGSQDARSVYSAADANGFSKEQAKRAKKRLRVEAKKVGSGPWLWIYPDAGGSGTPGPSMSDADAATWLQRVLEGSSNGRAEVGALRRRAGDCGVNDSQLDSARKRFAILVEQDFDGGSFWALPQAGVTRA